MAQTLMPIEKAYMLRSFIEVFLYAYIFYPSQEKSIRLLDKGLNQSFHMQKIAGKIHVNHPLMPRD